VPRKYLLRGREKRKKIARVRTSFSWKVKGKGGGRGHTSITGKKTRLAAPEEKGRKQRKTIEKGFFRGKRKRKREGGKGFSLKMAEGAVQR